MYHLFRIQNSLLQNLLIKKTSSYNLFDLAIVNVNAWSKSHLFLSSPVYSVISNKSNASPLGSALNTILSPVVGCSNAIRAANRPISLYFFFVF